MTNVAIVAIPEENSEFWHISSEKVPHLTIMQFGEGLSPETQSNIFDFLVHATNTSMCKFGLEIAYRQNLGDKNADVAVFSRRSEDYEKLEKFRSYLLTDQTIFEAYHAVEQFPQWLAHMTLGYPETPARGPVNGYFPNWVMFDKIALWVEDFDGPVIPLIDKYRDEREVGMSDQVEEFLAHFGVKGMKWGVRKVQQHRAARSAKQLEGASDDFKNAVAARSKAKKGGVKSLSNKELQDLITRMNLEQQLGRLTPPSNSARAVSTGAKFAGDVILGVGKQQATKLANDQATKLVAQMLKKS